jgi:cyclophilin family peptidyl-prolyl cis-trans isomerase
MTLELYPKAAPKTVAHFIELAKKGFYEGILFHRVEEGFVAQAGDPTSKKYQPSDLAGMTSEQVTEKYQLGGAGSGENVPLEAKLPHLANSIGLARADPPDSGDSQFYINLKDNAPLDSEYCVFGRIVSGADVAPKIKIGDRIKRLSVP